MAPNHTTTLSEAIVVYCEFEIITKLFRKGPCLAIFTVNNSNWNQSCNSGCASKCWLSPLALRGYPGITANIPQPTQSRKVITVNISQTRKPNTEALLNGCSFFAYSLKLSAYSGAFLLTVDNFSFYLQL